MPQDNAGGNVYGQQPMGSDPYGQQPMGSDPYGQQSMSSNAYGQAPTGGNVYGQQPMGGGYGQAPMGGGYGQPMGTPNFMGDLEEPVSLADWIVAYLLMCVPCVGIVMLFVWAFNTGTKKSKQNWARAQLIIVGVVILIYIIMFAVMGASMMSIMEKYS